MLCWQLQLTFYRSLKWIIYSGRYWYYNILIQYIILYYIILILSNIFSFIVHVNYTYYEIIYSITVIFQNAFIPFFVMIFGRLCAHDNIQESQKGDLFIATLVLCNFKPASIYRFIRIMNISLFIITDLSIYVSSFVLIHCLIRKISTF